jgi:hypothetical protein
VDPLILSSPGSSSLSEGEHRRVPFVHSAQAPAAGGPGAKEVARPTKRKRGQPGSDDGDSHNTIVKRPRLEQWSGPPGIGPAGPSASPAYDSRSRPSTTAAGPGVTQGTTPHSVSSSNDSSNSPATSTTPTAATPMASQPDPSLRPVQGHPSSAQPLESNDAVLRSTNPCSGPVSGGIVIWLGVDDLPTTFTLYARFGTQVVSTVSPVFHPLSLV